MAMYLTRFSYTPETWARMIENPEDRREAARSYIESVGGKLHGFWYAFGEFDGVQVPELRTIVRAMNYMTASNSRRGVAPNPDASARMRLPVRVAPRKAFAIRRATR